MTFDQALFPTCTPRWRVKSTPGIYDPVRVLQCIVQYAFPPVVASVKMRDSCRQFTSSPSPSSIPKCEMGERLARNLRRTYSEFRLSLESPNFERMASHSSICPISTSRFPPSFVALGLQRPVGTCRVTNPTSGYPLSIAHPRDLVSADQYPLVLISFRDREVLFLFLSHSFNDPYMTGTHAHGYFLVQKVLAV